MHCILYCILGRSFTAIERKLAGVLYATRILVALFARNRTEAEFLYTNEQSDQMHAALCI